jgi:hypothetical protein
MRGNRLENKPSVGKEDYRNVPYSISNEYATGKGRWPIQVSWRLRA